MAIPSSILKLAEKHDPFIMGIKKVHVDEFDNCFA